MDAPRLPGRIAAALALYLALPAVAQPGASASERLDRYLDGLTTLRADFQQEVLDASGALREQAAGRLAIAKPGRFRWDYRTPSEQLLVSDGRTVWLYDVDLEQVTRRAADKSLSATPAMLLSGQGKVSDTFSVAEGARAEGLEWVILTPRLGDTDFREVRLGFRGKQLERMDLADRLGQVTRIRYTAIEMNPELPADLFRFEVPPGVDVVGTAAAR